MTTGFGSGIYSARTAARVARVRYQSFQAWSKAHLVVGQRYAAGRGVETAYSYRDLLLLRLIAKLKEQGATPRAIRVALDTIALLAEGDRDAWMRATIFVSSGSVVAVLSEKPDWAPLAASQGPQKMAKAFFPGLIEDLKNELVPPEQFPCVEVDPNVVGGAPVVKGTRITTRTVAEAVEQGEDARELYPTLLDEQIQNAVEYERWLAVNDPNR